MSDFSESRDVANNNMTFVKASEGSLQTSFTSKLRFERPSRCIAGLEHFPTEEFPIVSYSDSIHSIGDWSVVFEVGCES